MASPSSDDDDSSKDKQENWEYLSSLVSQVEVWFFVNLLFFLTQIYLTSNLFDYSNNHIPKFPNIWLLHLLAIQPRYTVALMPCLVTLSCLVLPFPNWYPTSSIGVYKSINSVLFIYFLFSCQYILILCSLYCNLSFIYQIAVILYL